MSIGTQFARNISIPPNFSKEPFWGKYQELNKVTVPTISAIQDYQIKKIQEFEKESLSKMKPHAELNALFQSEKINNFYSSYTKQEQISIDEAITNIVKAINGTYWPRSGEKGSYQYNYQALQTQLKALQAAIDPVNKLLQQVSGRGIDGDFLDAIDRAIDGCELGDLGIADIEEWYKQINFFKGGIVEELGTQWLNNLGLPNLLTLNTGAINYQGSTANNRHTGQLIQDLMVMSIDDIDLDAIPIQYRTAGGAPITISLREFFDKVKSASGKSKQIIIEDEAYDLLESLSVMNIQAKAGLNQKPWNEKSANTQIALSQLGEDNLAVSAKRTIDLLHQLDCENIPEKSIWAKDTSKDYNLIADYGLATKLVQVLHLDGRQGNQYLLTPQGFTPYSVRLQKMMQERNSRLIFRKQINISPNSGDVMGQQRAIGMTGYR